MHWHTGDFAQGFVPRTHMSTKHSVMLWRIRWGFVTTFRRMRQYRIQSQQSRQLCLVCGKEEEALDILNHFSSIMTTLEKPQMDSTQKPENLVNP